MKQTIKMIFYCIIVLFLLTHILAAPIQNKTQISTASRHNKTVTHALANSNQNKTSITQQIENSKKTNIPTSPDELINTILGLALDAFGKISEFQEMIEELPIIG